MPECPIPIDNRENFCEKFSKSTSLERAAFFKCEENLQSLFLNCLKSREDFYAVLELFSITRAHLKDKNRGAYKKIGTVIKKIITLGKSQFSDWQANLTDFARSYSFLGSNQEKFDFFKENISTLIKGVADNLEKSKLGKRELLIYEAVGILEKKNKMKDPLDEIKRLFEFIDELKEEEVKNFFFRETKFKPTKICTYETNNLLIHFDNNPLIKFYIFKWLRDSLRRYHEVYLEDYKNEIISSFQDLMGPNSLTRRINNADTLYYLIFYCSLIIFYPLVFRTRSIPLILVGSFISLVFSLVIGICVYLSFFHTPNINNPHEYDISVLLKNDKGIMGFIKILLENKSTCSDYSFQVASSSSSKQLNFIQIAIFLGGLNLIYNIILKNFLTSKLESLTSTPESLLLGSAGIWLSMLLTYCSFMLFCASNKSFLSSLNGTVQDNSVPVINFNNYRSFRPFPGNDSGSGSNGGGEDLKVSKLGDNCRKSSSFAKNSFWKKSYNEAESLESITIPTSYEKQQERNCLLNN